MKEKLKVEVESMQQWLSLADQEMSQSLSSKKFKDLGSHNLLKKESVNKKETKKPH